MTAEQILTVIQFTPAAALAMVVIPPTVTALYVALRLYLALRRQLCTPMVVLAQASRGAHSAGRHHHSGGKHRAGKLQGNPLDHPTEKVDDKPKPPKPAKGGAR